MKAQGFTLIEMLVALMLSAVVMLSAMRLLPLLQQQNQHLLQKNQLRQEMQRLMMMLEKAVRRTGFCQGVCQGQPMQLAAGGRCLLLRWDDNGNGRWDSDELFGWRLRQQQMEMQRGEASCLGTGWERVSDPALLQVMDFSVARQNSLVRLMLTARLSCFPHTVQSLESWVRGENL